MSNIQLYSNEDFSVRTTQDTDGTVWFVARDIAEALDYGLDGGIGKYFSYVPYCWKGKNGFPSGQKTVLNRNTRCYVSPNRVCISS